MTAIMGWRMRIMSPTRAAIPGRAASAGFRRLLREAAASRRRKFHHLLAKPQWEFPRLCRGGSKSLTYPAVDTAAPSTKLRIASRQAHEEGFDGWMARRGEATPSECNSRKL